MKKYACLVSYAGCFYNGFQRQNNASSVQKKIEEIFSILMDKQIEVKAAGRTDAGVNALGQVVSFISDREINVESFKNHANRLFPSSISLNLIKEVPLSFDPRHSAKAKEYVYRFYLGKKDPFKNFTHAYLREDGFDLETFKKALSLFKGKHDFSNFTSKPNDKDDFIRDIETLEFDYDEASKTGSIRFISNGFMTYQIRFMVGEAILTARGKHTLEELEDMLNRKPRKIVSSKAPAEGLTLVRVIYDEELGL